MFKSLFNFSLFASIAMIAVSCTGTNNNPIIKFSRDSSSIIIKNFDEASLHQIKNIYQSNPDSANLVSVLLLPGELDSLQDQLAVSGKFKFMGDSLVFSPDQAFEKDKRYLIESFISVQFANTKKLISGTIKQNLQPQKQILKR